MGNFKNPRWISLCVLLTCGLIYIALIGVGGRERSQRQSPLVNLNFLLEEEGVGAKDAETLVCYVTRRTELIRRLKGTTHINPAKEIIDDLIETVVPERSRSVLEEDLCKGKREDEKIVLVMVKSSRSNFHVRRLIRRNWGLLWEYEGWKVRLLFLMGQSDFCYRPESERENMTNAKEAYEEEIELRKESQVYGDLVIGTYADTYRNLTYKTMTAYKFILDNCPEADLVIKTDDDMFVDIPKILDTRNKELEARKQNSTYRMYDIYCHEWKDKPARDNKSVNAKWITTKEEWPEEWYPLFCLGNDYAITVPWMTKVFTVRHHGGFFWIDDIFTNGVLREIAEKVYHEDGPAKLLKIRQQATDKRWSSFVKDNCKEEVKEDKFGLFVFLVRGSPDFVMEVECLWQRVMRRIDHSKKQYRIRQE